MGGVVAKEEIVGVTLGGAIVAPLRCVLMLPLISDMDLMGSTLVPLLFLLGRLTIPFISASAPATAKLRPLLNDLTLPFGGSTVLDKN